MQGELPGMTAASQITCSGYLWSCARSLKSLNGDNSAYLRLVSYTLLPLSSTCPLLIFLLVSLFCLDFVKNRHTCSIFLLHC